MEHAVIASAVLLGVAFAGKREVAEAPRWMTEKDQVRVEIVEKLLEGGDAVRALELIRIMRQEGVDRYEIDLLQGVALRQQGMAEEAQRMLEQVADDHPRDPDVHRELCVLYADEQMIDDAIASCERATELDPQNAAAWNNLGWLQLTAGAEPKAAREALQRAVELDATEARYRNNLAFAQAAAGEHRSALRTFLTTGTPADAHYNVGTAFERSGDLTSAATYYRRALRYEPEHSLAADALRALETPENRRSPDDAGEIHRSPDDAGEYPTDSQTESQEDR